MRLIIATHNQNKLKEIKKLLINYPYQIISLAELRKKIVIRETGKTFKANAEKKALAVSKLYPRDYVLGEDSGLTVDYLSGRPGIYSKRYSGTNATDLKNNAKLLKELNGVPSRKRTAAYKCLLALAKAGKILAVFEGECCGRINIVPRGVGGFGYDPLFYIPKLGKTTAQITLTEKNKISHRADAFNKFKKYLSKKTVKAYVRKTKIC